MYVPNNSLCVGAGRGRPGNVNFSSFYLLPFTGFVFFWFNALHVDLLCFAPMSESEKEKKGRTSTSLLKHLKMSNR